VTEIRREGSRFAMPTGEMPSIAPRARALRALAVRLAAARTMAALAAGPARPPAAHLDRLTIALARFGALPGIEPEALAHCLEDGDPPLLLDVRSAAEHATSHIARSQLLAPSARQLPAAIAAACRGRMVVAYCAVGVRSTLALLRHADALERAGATHFANLSGGLFAWHRAGLPMVDAHGPADVVHPYDRRWGQLRSTADPSALAHPVREPPRLGRAE
jgi:rhodanese-related sulfurtransferase